MIDNPVADEPDPIMLEIDDDDERYGIDPARLTMTTLVTKQQLVPLIGRSYGTLCQWDRDALITRRGTDERGRTLYDLDEVTQAAQHQAERQAQHRHGFAERRWEGHQPPEPRAPRRLPTLPANARRCPVCDVPAHVHDHGPHTEPTIRYDHRQDCRGHTRMIIALSGAGG